MKRRRKPILISKKQSIAVFVVSLLVLVGAVVALIYLK